MVNFAKINLQVIFTCLVTLAKQIIKLLIDLKNYFAVFFFVSTPLRQPEKPEYIGIIGQDN